MTADSGGTTATGLPRFLALRRDRAPSYFAGGVKDVCPRRQLEAKVVGGAPGGNRRGYRADRLVDMPPERRMA